MRSIPALTAAAVLAALLGSTPVAALPAMDRLAVELLPGEEPYEAALAFESACWRQGISIDRAVPAQLFEHDGSRFVRLRILGGGAPHACLAVLAKRRSVDGTFRWFDSFAGGLVLEAAVERGAAKAGAEPAGDGAAGSQDGAEPADDRVADAVWYRPDEELPPVPADARLVEQLAQGSSAALEALSATPVPAALAAVDRLSAAPGPASLLALERVAREHPHWRVRRAAVLTLAPAASFEALAALAQVDKHWAVRLAVMEILGRVAEGMVEGAEPLGEEAARVLLTALEKDKAWEVRRTAVWQLSVPRVKAAAATLRRIAGNDRHPAVRVAALEALFGAGELKRDDARRALQASNDQVRAVAAAALVDTMKSQDAPDLWRAMTDRARVVRLAAVGLLDRVDDSTLGPKLWPLYVAEADQLDADPGYLSAVLDALARHPPPGVAKKMRTRLKEPLSPVELRLLARSLARVSPQDALAVAAEWLDSPNPELRSVAADALPDTAEVRRRRFALLDDPVEEVRAGAVLGLCRTRGGEVLSALGLKSEAALVTRAALAPGGIAQEAILAAQRCGRDTPDAPRIRTALFAANPARPSRRVVNPAGTVAALLGCLLLMGTVIGEKIARGPSRPSREA